MSAFGGAQYIAGDILSASGSVHCIGGISVMLWNTSDALMIQ